MILEDICLSSLKYLNENVTKFKWSNFNYFDINQSEG